MAAFARSSPQAPRPRQTQGATGSVSDEISIRHRPHEVAEREVFGAWECDLIQFRQEYGGTNLTSLVERVSRFTVLMKNADRRSRPVMDGLIASLSPLPAHARQSITFDRGLEFLAWPYLQAGLGVATWFCDPQSPWQKGTVENPNGRIRRWLPREIDPNLLTYPRYRGDLSAPQLHATQMLRLPHTCRGLSRKAHGRSGYPTLT